MFNQITLAGNLTRDIEVKYTQSGVMIASSAIATSRKYTQNGEKKEETCFIDVTFFGKTAEVANNWLRKGSKVLLVGRLKQDQWTAQDNSKRSKHHVIVETMTMIGCKNDSGQQSQQQQYQAQQQPQQYQQQAQAYQPQQQPAQQYQQQKAPTVEYQNAQGKPIPQQPQQYQQQAQQVPQQPNGIEITEDSIQF